MALLRIGSIGRHRLLASSRQYARVVGGILNQPPPPAPSPQPDFKTIQVGKKSTPWEALVKDRREPEVATKSSGEFHLDISQPPKSTQQTEFRTVMEPPQLKPQESLHQHLIQKVRDTPDIQSSRSLVDLMDELTAKANAEIPNLLKNGNAGSPANSLNEIAESVVTIAHVLPPTEQGDAGEVILCSGFAILDGSLVATCTHPFFQIHAHCKGDKGHARAATARTLIITKSGVIVPLKGVESHLVMSDIVILRIPEDQALVPLQVSPYPCPAGNPIQVYNLHDTYLDSETNPVPKWSWKESEITVYQDRAGREAATGTYDELNTLLFDSIPLPGSSGGPILDRETKAVVGVVRGSEFSYAFRKERGFGTPAETLFNVFQLEM